MTDGLFGVSHGDEEYDKAYLVIYTFINHLHDEEYDKAYLVIYTFINHLHVESCWGNMKMHTFWLIS